MLDRRDFVVVGRDGIGNARSEVAQSMAYFRDRLYLGVTHPKGEGPADAARILRFDPTGKDWRTVYQSPLRRADVNAVVRDVYRGPRAARHDQQRSPTVPRHRGIRSMTLFHPRDQSEPWLVASTLSHWGSQLIVTRDGERFEEVSEAGLGNRDVLSFRAMLGFKHMLFASPVGSVKDGVMDRMFGDVARLYVSEDPLSGNWREAVAPGFGDASNRSVLSMAVFNGFLYAGTGNPERGFDVWKTDAEGAPPFSWTRVLTRGAWRHNLNEIAAVMTELGGFLYVGSGIPGLGYDKANDVGPAAAEIVRVGPDDHWDLVVGAPRFTPDGWMVPTSGFGPGFGDPDNSTIWAMATFDRALYVGTHHCGPYRSALRGEPRVRGGFQLWSSPDGSRWQPVILDGFGDPYAAGVRTLAPTPAGLFVGTSTHREIERFWARRTGQPASATAGGLSVLLGQSRRAPARVAATRSASPGRTA
jgi:hypothetical protein